ncbi:unnamed protein product [Didymodactylos carnosus]|uniref:Uncharacterized protein n=1 Tax=Didymodactylos carnosus TaxID=1234261 RepID=A0A8S2DDW8_9BILA|nr:unnamed protein product [Didymodactylos carnosus]CAF3712070.1 unnamed protein product [Didymodactylos carnosus]
MTPVENTSDVIHNHRPLLSRGKSVATINNDDNDDKNDEVKTRPLSMIVRDGSCVEKLRQLFANKSSNDLRSSTTRPPSQSLVNFAKIAPFSANIGLISG